MAQHLCPSCGFVHLSDGNEVPAIEVTETRPPTLDEIATMLQSAVRRYGFTLKVSIEDILQARRGELERQAQSDSPLPPTESHCPICISLGGSFVTTDVDAFNKHMTGDIHGKESTGPAATEPVEPSTTVNTDPPATEGV